MNRLSRNPGSHSGSDFSYAWVVAAVEMALALLGAPGVDRCDGVKYGGTGDGALRGKGAMVFVI